MSDKLSKAPTLSLDLSDFNHITRSELHYDDHIGLNNALREAQHSTHSTQVGASVNGIDPLCPARYPYTGCYHVCTLGIMSPLCSGYSGCWHPAGSGV